MNKFIFVLCLLLPAFSRAEPACVDAGKIYHLCRDQNEVLAEALAAAKRDHKQLVVGVGADWCPWCRSLHTLLAGQEFTGATGGNFQVAEIGLFQERTKLPSGVAALEQLKKMAGIKAKTKGIPQLFVVDPVVNRARWLDTGKLEQNTKDSKGHDPQKVFAAISKAGNELK
jgi:thiol-disulfide isomerase/thioredoxin